MDTKFKKGMVPWNKANAYLTCPNCKKKFRIKPSHSSRRRFCSRGCKRLSPQHREKVREVLYRNSQNAKNKKLLIEKKCKQCGKVFVYTSRKPKKKFCSIQCVGKYASIYLRGSKSYNWKGGITNPDKHQRRLFRQFIHKKVLERDGYTCQMCGVRGGKLQVDHIQPWSEYIELRFKIDNCRTLCIPCHYKVTFGKNIPNQSMSWGYRFPKQISHEYNLS